MNPKALTLQIVAVILLLIGFFILFQKLSQGAGFKDVVVVIGPIVIALALIVISTTKNFNEDSNRDNTK